MSVSADQFLLMGKITRPHGLAGELKVFPITDDPERLQILETVYIGPDPETVMPFTVVSTRIQQVKNGVQVILNLKELASRTEAEPLHKQFVYALETDLPLEDDEVFLHDLIGLPVETEDGALVGTLKEILPLPAHDVYVVARPALPDAMVPAVPAFIVEASPEAGRVRIRPIDGLLD